MGHWVFEKELTQLLPNGGRGEFSLNSRALLGWFSLLPS